MTTQPLPSVKRVLCAVAKTFEVDEGALLSSSRKLRHAHSRQAAMYILRQMDFSLDEIGQMLGGRHHTTVMHGVDAAEQRAKSDKRYATRLLVDIQRADEARS